MVFSLEQESCNGKITLAHLALWTSDVDLAVGYLSIKLLPEVRVHVSTAVLLPYSTLSVHPAVFCSCRKERLHVHKL